MTVRAEAATRLGFDPEAATGLLADAARGLIMPKYGRLLDSEVHAKSSPTDLVTEVDLAVEDFLRERLAALAPDAGFIGEEAAAADPTIVAGVEGEGRCWVLDPLDGTRNFVRGAPEFATILALVENGRTIAGWIYSAPEDYCAVAVAGCGVTLAGDAPPPGAPAADPPHGLRSVGWLSETWTARMMPNLRARVGTRAGHCSAYAYLKLLAGDIDFKISSRIHPWDHAAGALMLQEAGGRVAFLDRASPEDYAPRDSVDRPLLASAPGRDFAGIAARLLVTDQSAV